MQPNAQQIKSIVRWLVAAFGAGFAGFIAGKGWGNAAAILAFLNSDTFAQDVVAIVQGVAAIVSLFSLVAGLFAHTEKATVAAADAMPNTAGVVVKDTPAGHELVRAVPSPTVAVAGTSKAVSISNRRG